MENDKIRWLGKEKNAKCNEKSQNLLTEKIMLN